MENKIYKLKTFKRINQDATILGFPFSVFFILFFWVLIFGMLVGSVKSIMKIPLILIGLGGVGLMSYIYNKKGLKNLQKGYDLYFKKVDVIKINEQIIIKKLKLK